MHIKSKAVFDFNYVKYYQQNLLSVFNWLVLFDYCATYTDFVQCNAKSNHMFGTKNVTPNLNE